MQVERTSLPDTVEEMIDYLDARFPEQCIQLNESLDSALRRSGARDVIVHLRSLQKERNEEGMPDVFTQYTGT